MMQLRHRPRVRTRARAVVASASGSRYRLRTLRAEIHALYTEISAALLAEKRRTK